MWWFFFFFFAFPRDFPTAKRGRSSFTLCSRSSNLATPLSRCSRGGWQPIYHHHHHPNPPPTPLVPAGWVGWLRRAFLNISPTQHITAHKGGLYSRERVCVCGRFIERKCRFRRSKMATREWGNKGNKGGRTHKRS